VGVAALATACASEPPAARCPPTPTVGEQAPHDRSCTAADGGAASVTTGADAAPPPKGVPEERQVLVDFYQSTRGANWVKQDNWLSQTADHCQWHGVECDASGHVTQLTLYDNDLDGPLPESLCRLERLQTLYFSFNRISGELPKSIGQCKSLKNLWLK